MVSRRNLAIDIAGGIIVGAACAALTFLPAATNLEQETGLRWLFQLRGSISPPPEVAMVLISDRASRRISLSRNPERFHRCEGMAFGSAIASQLHLPSMPSRWPRCMHALLVHKLVTAGASVIAFDMLFRPRPPLPGANGDLHAWQDEMLAAEFASSGRVLVAQRLESKNGEEKLSELSTPIETAVLGLGPFPLVHGSSGRLDRFIAFQDSGWATPSLPVLAVQALARDQFQSLAESLSRQSPDGALLMPGTERSRPGSMQLQTASRLARQIIHRTPEAADRIATDLQGMQRPAGSEPKPSPSALIAMYKGEGTRWINFYGPAGTIPSVPYDRVLEGDREWLASIFSGRVVFVGYADIEHLEQADHFATAFSSAGQPDHSGVEIAATAFGNLLENRTIHATAFSAWFALVFVSGFLATLACRIFSYRTALATVAAGLLLFAAVVLYRFFEHDAWIAFIVPMFVAVPVGVASAFTWRLVEVHRERDRMRAAIRIFVPRDLAEQIERNASLTDIAPENVECGCVATDAANFTPLAETMSSQELAEFLNQYFKALFEPVAVHGGFVSDVVGDAMLAIWKQKLEDVRIRMLSALLSMRDAAQHFNETTAARRLMTRFGVDWGSVTLTAVGALDHYEYRAVGDTVNTSSRIQELNKKLGTRVLVSQVAFGTSQDSFLARDLGSFLLRGKQVPVRIFELMEVREKASESQFELADRFGRFIQLLDEGRIEEAQRRVRELSSAYPDDGPIAFYLHSLSAGVPLTGGAMRVG